MGCEASLQENRGRGKEEPPTMTMNYYYYYSEVRLCGSTQLRGVAAAPAVTTSRGSTVSVVCCLTHASEKTQT